MKTYLLGDKDIVAIDRHYRTHFTAAGAKDSGLVLHEIISDGMHIDLVHYLPTDAFPYHIFATMGMSAYKMPNTTFNRIELMMFLPREWQVTDEALKETKWYWPISTLKSAARLPYETGNPLGLGHTFSMDVDNPPFDPVTEMCAGLIALPEMESMPEAVVELTYGGLFSKRKINFLCMTTINKEELANIRGMGLPVYLEKTLSGEIKEDIIVRNKR